MGLNVKGFIENTLLDYPGKIAAVVFLGGCNFRCPFCQNPALVLHPELEPSIPEEGVLERLAQPQMKKWVDGVCVSGGEPCVQKGLPEFLRKLKALGYLVKLDTNGSNPEMLSALFKEKLVDYVAMDVKAPLEKYDAACGVKVDGKAVAKSVGLIRKSGVDYEFRATVVPGLFSREDAIGIGKWLEGSKKFFLQQFRSAVTLDPSFEGREHFHAKELKELAEAMKPFFQEVGIRGA